MVDSLLNSVSGYLFSRKKRVLEFFFWKMLPVSKFVKSVGIQDKLQKVCRFRFKFFGKNFSVSFFVLALTKGIFQFSLIPKTVLICEKGQWAILNVSSPELFFRSYQKF